MNFNSDFDLKKAKNLLLTETYESSLQEMEVERLGIYGDIDDDLLNGDYNEDYTKIDYLNDIIDYCNKEINSIQNFGGGESDDEELEENASLEEMASIAQVIPALQTRNTPKDQEKIDIIQNAYQTTLSQFDPATAQITKDGRLQGFASAFKKNLPSKDYFEKVAAELDLKNSDLAVNTTEKTAANDLLGKTSNKPGPVKKSTSDEPAAEPKVRAEKPAKEKSPTLKITNPKAGEKPVSSVFGGGENDPEEMEMAKQAAKAAKGSKEFADEVAPDKTEKFNLGLKFVTKYKDDRNLVDAYLKKAKDEYKLSANMIKDLKRAAGRQVEA